MAKAKETKKGNIQLTLSEEEARFLADIIGECDGQLTDITDPILYALGEVGVGVIWKTSIRRRKEFSQDLAIALDDDPDFENVESDL